MIKRLAILFLIFAVSAAAQGVRFSGTVTQQTTVNGVPTVTIPANPSIKFCLHPANAVPCTNTATTYTDQTLATPCAGGNQIVRDGTNTCVASPDAQDNWGVWYAPNTLGYDYTITLPGGINLGPFNVLSQTTTISTIIGPITISGSLTVSGAATFTGPFSTNNVTGTGSTFTIATAPTGATESGNTVTITTTAPCNFTTGQWVNVTKVGVVQYNGTWLVLTPGCNGGSSFTFTQSNNASMANSGGGSVSAAPFVATGGPSSISTQNTGAFDNLDYYLYNLNEIGGCNYRSVYQNISGHKDMSANANCVTVPVTSTQDQADGIGSAMRCFAGTATSCTAILAVGEADSVNARVFGLGSVVNDNGFLTSTNVGQENDVGWSAASTSIGLNLVSFGNTPPNSSTGALLIQNNTPGTPANGWGTGIKLGAGTSVAPSATQAGMLFGPLSTGNSQPSQGWAMNATNSGGSTLTCTGSEDSSGNANYNCPTAHAFSVAGTTRATVSSAGITAPSSDGTAALTALTATTNQKLIELANTGNSGFYFGVESSVSGGFFTGSNAYESVLWNSGANNLFIRSPITRFSGSIDLGNTLFISQTAPTIGGGGCGGTVAAIQNANGTASFEIFTGTAPTSAGCTVTFPAAAHHWICPTITHTSAVSTTNFIILQTGALSSTSVTFQLFSDVAAATAPAASDTWAVSGCHAN